MSLSMVGVLEESDVQRLPSGMLDALMILRRIAHCGMPLAKLDGTLTVYLALREPGSGLRCAVIRDDGSIKFYVEE